MFDSARSLAKTIYFDESTSDMFYSDIEDIEYIRYLNKLSAFRNANPFVYSVQIYNGEKFYVSPSINFVYPKSSFPDAGIVSILGDMQTYKSNSVVPRKVPDLTGLQNDGKDGFVNVYSYLFYDSQMQSGKISEAIILNIYESSMRESINSFSNGNDKRIFIIDSNGMLITEDEKYPMLHNMSNQKYIRDILKSEKKSGNIRAEVDNVDSFITYVSADVLDWKFISVIPYSRITEKINMMKVNTYIFVVIILFIGITLSLYISRRLYIPVRTTLINMSALELERKSIYYNKKQEFLAGLVKSSTCTIDSIEKKFTDLKVNLDPFAKLLLIVIRIDNYSKFCNEYNLDDRKILKFGSMNIISEIFSKRYKNECIDIGEDYIVVLLNYADDLLPSRNNSLSGIISEIQESVKQYLQFSISVTVGEVFTGVHLLNRYYLTALELSYYRYILGHQCVIYPENITILNADDYKYPIDSEKSMIDSLMLGRMDEAKEMLSKIIQNSLNYGQSVINTTVLRLLISINNSIDILHRNNGIDIDYNFDAFLTNHRKAETMGETQAMFFKLFDDISEQIELKKEPKYDKIVEEVIDIIEREHMNPNLSLEMLAELVDMSPSYLSRLFKKIKLVSINDYINNIRMEKAKELLLATKEPINIIMEKTGFLSRSHFYTLFKKLYGVTPNQFRQTNLFEK